MASKNEHGSASSYLCDLSNYAGRRLWLALLLMVLVAVTEGVGLLLLLPLLKLVIGGAEESVGPAWLQAMLGGVDGPELSVVLMVFVLLVVCRALLLRARELVLNGIQLGFTNHLRKRLYHSIGEARWGFLMQQRSARMGHVLSVDIERVGQGTHFLLELMVMAGLAVAYVLVALTLSPIMTAVALGSGGFLVLLLWPQMRRSRDMGAALTLDSQRVYESVSDFLAGLKLARSYRREPQHAQRFSSLVEVMQQRMLGFVRSRATTQAIYQIGAAVVLSLLVYLAVAVLALPGASLLLLVLVFARLLPMLSQMQRSWQHAVHMLPAYAEAKNLLQQCEQQREPPVMASLPPLMHSLQLSGVSYRYPGARKVALDGVDLRIPVGQITALVGASGAGKSTVADLLLGLLCADQGELRIDEQSLDAAQLPAWRGHVAYVPQEAFLFHESVRNNLLWAVPEASEAALWEALRRAGAEALVAELPQGLDTLLGERGSRLSGGERQRIALARALLLRPQLLLMDEATSALDSANEKQVLETVRELAGEPGKGLSVLLIAHRPASVRMADWLVVLDQGRVVQQGARDRLLASPAAYLDRLLEGAGVSTKAAIDQDS